MLGFNALGRLALGQAADGGALQTLTPSLFTDGDTFFTPKVSFIIYPSLFTDGDTFHSPTVTVGAVNLSPSLYSDADTFYTPQLNLIIYPNLYSDADTFNSHTLSIEQFLFPDYFAKHAYVAMVRQI